MNNASKSEIIAYLDDCIEYKQTKRDYAERLADIERLGMQCSDTDNIINALKKVNHILWFALAGVTVVTLVLCLTIGSYVWFLCALPILIALTNSIVRWHIIPTKTALLVALVRQGEDAQQGVKDLATHCEECKVNLTAYANKYSLAPTIYDETVNYAEAIKDIIVRDATDNLLDALKIAVRLNQIRL